MAQKDTIDRAYGHVPKEVVPQIDLVTWYPTLRGIKYYWLKLVRWLTR